MNIRQIEVFRAVMRNQTASKAAEILRISQPAVSKAIRELEHDIGFGLFTREKGRIWPTAEARLFLKEVEAQYEGLVHLNSAAARIRDFGAGEIRVGSLSALSTNVLPKALHAFTRRHPGVAVNFQAQLSSVIRDLVASGQLDAGIAADEIDVAGVDARPFARYRAAIAVPMGHRLSSVDVITSADINGEPFIALSPEDTTRRSLEAVFASANSHPRVILETPYSTTVCAMVQAGLGIGLINPITAEPYIGKGLSIHAFEPAIYFKSLLLLPANSKPSKIVSDFVEEAMRFSIFEV
ncbi:LysR substrate-binding domain-containing protein [Rhizobium sp. 2MFCol3.1]|uniref:LysR substrate-binding domain-containing protein n=1 Tax=Rhizobium sp. 2MFCol3.1 TaxID=1246459 RepID=UPI00047689A3|nr:LysR substrate-binding domain-containing protein [Rhizobium sp. 2MFCol3.1]